MAVSNYAIGDLMAFSKPFPPRWHMTSDAVIGSVVEITACSNVTVCGYAPGDCYEVRVVEGPSFLGAYYIPYDCLEPLATFCADENHSGFDADKFVALMGGG